VVFYNAGQVSAHFTGYNHMHPDVLDITLCPGDCYTEIKRVDLEAPPLYVDIIFGIDATETMDRVLAQLQLDAMFIMTDTRTIVGDTNFGCVSHRDYPGFHEDYCGYSALYGELGDWPYRLEQDITHDLFLVETAIKMLVAGGGGDGPDSYTRMLYESYADPAIHWRYTARKFLINFADNIPHDPDFLACLGLSPSCSGLDPGRDELHRTADDLFILPTVDEMLNQEITLITLLPHGDVLLWDCYAARTGGQAKRFVSYTDIRTHIYDMLITQLFYARKLELKTEPGYEDWLASVTPPLYSTIVLTTPVSKTFSIQICMPAGTPPGIYNFKIYAVGDGGVLAEQAVRVRHCIPLPIDPVTCHLLYLLPLILIITLRSANSSH
jgi:hypothetical protein